jgi:hypothetical protein
MIPHLFGSLDPDPDSDPHSDKKFDPYLDPDPHCNQCGSIHKTRKSFRPGTPAKDTVPGGINLAGILQGSGHGVVHLQED